MNASTDDIAKITAQEAALVFSTFDEATAFAIGSALRDRALAEKLPIVVDIQLWDRPLFYAALPGSTASNTNWARRKRNVVRIYQKSTYRMVHEKARPDRIFPPADGLDPADHVLAGGGFPITVNGVGVIGVIAVSGLPERQDHAVIVEVLCAHLGLEHAALALPAA
ncbi:heme-degrading domain-containing protein [Mesorhizobium sp. IMUNJ 23232]|uniref:heme-degrading domain-containing protein n=1 Tax=Mesorhizobium sp. IMUNJ 23232 TaxID=3376064 RepID=UPI0037AC374E